MNREPQHRDTERVGERVRTDRQAAGLTQRALAELAGVSIGMIRDLEQHRTQLPARRSIRLLEAALPLDISWTLTPPAHPRERRTRLWVEVLGPLGVWCDGTPLALGGKQRVLLAILALHPNRWMHRETLIDAIWPDSPPASASSLVQTYAARLSRLLQLPRTPLQVARSPLARNANSYRLTVSRDELDLLTLKQLTSDAQLAFGAGDVAGACALYERAIALWQPEPLCDIEALRGTTMVQALPRQSASLVAEYAHACGSMGWYSRSLPHLEDLIERDPLNEQAQACLITALAGTGQQAAALSRYHLIRAELDAQLGIRPSSILTDAYTRILQHRLVRSDGTPD